MTDYNFIARCPICNEKRGVTCSREQARSGERVEVFAIQCNAATPGSSAQKTVNCF